MTTPNIDVDVLMDLGEFLSELDETKRAALDLSPIFAGKVDQIVTEFLRKRFDTEGAYLGEKWAPLAKRTLQVRKRPGRGRGGILRDTNTLWGAITKSGGPGSIRDIQPLLYRRGTTDPKAAIHQTGATIKRLDKAAMRVLMARKKGGRRGLGAGLRYTEYSIPARPILPDPVPPVLMDEITTAVRDWLAKQAAA